MESFFKAKHIWIVILLLLLISVFADLRMFFDHNLRKDAMIPMSMMAIPYSILIGLIGMMYHAIFIKSEVIPNIFLQIARLGFIILFLLLLYQCIGLFFSIILQVEIFNSSYSLGVITIGERLKIVDLMKFSQIPVLIIFILSSFYKKR